MTLNSIPTPQRDIRPSTLHATQKSQQSPLYPNNRKSLAANATASITRDEIHDCSDFNADNTKIKVNARFYFSLFRFYVAYAWECETTRGKTYLNGSVCHCNDGCEAGHAALTPNLLDNKLKKICDKILANDFNALEPHEREYMRRKFTLVDSDIEKLSDRNEQAEHLSILESRLSTNEKLGTFVNTPVEIGRAVTYANPRSSNRIDCYLEHRLRKVEDELSSLCTKQEMTPKNALQELHKKQLECLQELAENLNESDLKITRINSVMDYLFSTLSATPFDFDTFLDALKMYLEAHEDFFEKKYGVPQTGLKDELNKHIPIYWVKKLLSDTRKGKAFQFLKSNKDCFVPTQEGQDLFKKAKQEISLRKKETAAQMEIAGLPYEQIHSLLKLEFGEKDSDGNIITPTQKGMATTLTGYIHPRNQDAMIRKRNRTSH